VPVAGAAADGEVGLAAAEVGQTRRRIDDDLAARPGIAKAAEAADQPARGKGRLRADAYPASAGRGEGGRHRRDPRLALAVAALADRAVEVEGLRLRRHRELAAQPVPQAFEQLQRLGALATRAVDLH